MKKKKYTRVSRPRWKAACYYDRLQRFYDLIAGPFEWPKTEKGIQILNPKPVELILEIGSGTGKAPGKIGDAVGPDGQVTGIDISKNMVQAAREHLQSLGMGQRSTIIAGDALRIDCRPIPGREILEDHGFLITEEIEESITGIPVTILLGEISA